ncbi:7380_t:CDS:2, partial [Acaulospora morrowiae]
MADKRKEELQKKRAKLEELRRAREDRKNTPVVKEKPPVQQQPSRKDELDAILRDLLDTKSGPKVEPVQTPEPALPEEAESTGTPGQNSTDTTGPPTTSSDTISSSDIPSSTVTSVVTRFVPEFTSFDEIVLDLPPKEIVYYTKEAQTIDTSFTPPPPSEETIREKVWKEFEAEQKIKEAAAEEQRLQLEAEKKKKEAKPNDLSDQEKKNIVLSSEFNEFVEHT